jgi:hypothetical protein
MNKFRQCPNCGKSPREVFWERHFLKYTNVRNARNYIVIIAERNIALIADQQSVILLENVGVRRKFLIRCHDDLPPLDRSRFNRKKPGSLMNGGGSLVISSDFVLL